MGIDNRPRIYIDGLDENQQQVVRDVVERSKNGLMNER